MNSLAGIRFTNGIEKAEVTSIRVPLLEQIQQTPTFGYFELERIAFSKDSTYFYDAWLLSTSQKDAQILEGYTGDLFKGSIICCWTTGPEISKKLTGFARIIHYYDKYNEGSKPSTAFQIWEGVVREGKPNGFCRFISATSDYSFVGFLKNWFTTQKGTGLYFQEEILRYSGIYEDGTPVEEAPAVERHFSEFSQDI